MKYLVPGARIKQIREALGMSVPQFSSVLAVHPGTIHRWESHGSVPVPVDGVAANVLAALDQKVRPETTFPAQKVGNEVAEALLIGGALLALGLLIKELTKR